VQSARRAASRAAWIAGKSSATKMPMIAITTSSSTSVNACRPLRWIFALRFREIEFPVCIDGSSIISKYGGDQKTGIGQLTPTIWQRQLPNRVNRQPITDRHEPACS
jgi:hypothetical protein